MPEHWRRAGLPAERAAILQSLHLREPLPGPPTLSESEWARALEFADAAGLTLFVAQRLGAWLPPDVQQRTTVDLEHNRERLRQLEAEYRAIAGRLHQASIPFVLLKGWTQCALSGLDAGRRVQYDIDLWTERGDVHRAAAALQDLGFEPFSAMEPYPADHLPPLIRKTGWQFRGDYFDPGIPVSIELHFQLWGQDRTRLAAPGIDEFWERRQETLAPADALGHTSLHLVKHLLHGSVRPFHVFELAAMLERQCANHQLWRQWLAWHHPRLRRLEVVGFRLAEAWFGCALPEAIDEDWRMLPASTRAWFQGFAFSPALPSNKNELWLHASLLESRRDCFTVARRRLLPGRLPPPVDAVYLPDRALTWKRRMLRRFRQAGFLAQRVRHHAKAALRLAGAGARWWRLLRATSR